MAASKKPPSLASAASVARTVSRIMRYSGFVMADTSDRHRWTPGWYVQRIGYSRTVSVSYYHGDKVHARTSEEWRSRVDDRNRVMSALRERGYPVDDQGYIECERD